MTDGDPPFVPLRQQFLEVGGQIGMIHKSGIRNWERVEPRISTDNRDRDHDRDRKKGRTLAKIAKQRKEAPIRN